MSEALLVRHPAKFTDAILPVVVMMLNPLAALADDGLAILDPFAGTGKIHRLNEDFGWDTVGVELESEWAAMHPRTVQGNALHLPYNDGRFDAIVTSPTYGNRMADTYDGRDGSKRATYRIALGRELSEDSSAGLQWGTKYRDFHEAAWEEAIRVLRPHGVFVLNMKDHIRNGEVQKVTAWHIETLEGLGLAADRWQKVETPGNRFGANGNLRIEYEWVVRLWKK